MSILDLLAPKDLARVARLQVFAREVVEGSCSGRHRSPQKGFSVDFKEHRQYVRGDELRNIDWKVFGKSDKLFVRQYEEETNLRCYLMVDTSGSMAYAGSEPGVAGDDATSKFDYAVRLSACLAFMMLGQQDAVGLVTFDDRPRKVLPASGRASHLQAVLAALVSQSPGRETDLGQSLRQAAGTLKRRGLVVVLSDAMGDVTSLGRSLAQLRRGGHDLVFFQILHPDEQSFPFKGRVRFRNLEIHGDEQTVETGSLRQLYLDRLAEHQVALRRVCRAHRVDLVTMTTDRPFIDGLHEYVSVRRRPR